VIKDPLCIENNIGKSTYRIYDIKGTFETAASVLNIEKDGYYELDEKEISKYIEKALKNSQEFTDGLYFLSKIFKCHFQEE